MASTVMNGPGSRLGLTQRDLSTIRRRYSTGKESQRSLARRYGVARHTIQRVIYQAPYAAF